MLKHTGRGFMGGASEFYRVRVHGIGVETHRWEMQKHTYSTQGWGSW